MFEIDQKIQDRRAGERRRRRKRRDKAEEKRQTKYNNVDEGTRSESRNKRTFKVGGKEES